jgi:hypothetical protein
MKKKLMAIVSAAVMCLSAVSATGFTVSAEEESSTTFQESTAPEAAHELDWLPVTMSDYENFIEQYGNVSVHGKYIVYCDTIDYSTGAEVILQQLGTAEIEKVKGYSIATDEVLPPGSPSKIVYVYEAKSAGTVKVTISQGRPSDETSQQVKDTGYYQIDDSMSIVEIDESEFTEPVKGDCNLDGVFNVSDVVLFQKWLVAAPDIKLSYWKAADFCEDGTLDVFDLYLMKRALIESGQIVVPEKITFDDVIQLSKKGDELTWSDFDQYVYEDIGSGLYIFKYEIENDDTYLLIGGDNLNEKPSYIDICNESLVTHEIESRLDIRSDEFKELLNWLEELYEPENDETNQDAALKIGKYALSELKEGNYTLDTKIYSDSAPEMMSEEIAELFNGKVFLALSFVDEHTVLLSMNKGLLDAYGYLITDGTVKYDIGAVSVPNEGYDGDIVDVEWVGEDIYYFTAGT